MNNEQIDLMINSLKEIKKLNKKRERLSSVYNSENVTQKRLMLVSNDITYTNHYKEEEIFKLHTLIVKNKLANPFNDNYYKDTTFEPSCFHKYTVKRPHPLK